MAALQYPVPRLSLSRDILEARLLTVVTRQRQRKRGGRKQQLLVNTCETKGTETENETEKHEHFRL